jgi:hypothetical protein
MTRSALAVLLSHLASEIKSAEPGPGILTFWLRDTWLRYCRHMK